jgi:hypothetical protein
MAAVQQKKQEEMSRFKNQDLEKRTNDIQNEFDNLLNQMLDNR